MPAIRRVRPEDFKQVLQLEHEAFPDPYPDAFLRWLLGAHANAFFVAEVEAKILGYSVGLMQSDETGHILSVAVAAEHQGKGIGKRLISTAIAELETLGAKRIVLEARKSNVKARDFYSKMGFKPVKTVKRYYSDREDAVQYQLDIRNREDGK